MGKARFNIWVVSIIPSFAIVIAFFLGLMLGDMGIEDQITAPATEFVALADGTKLKVFRIGGRQFLIAEYLGTGPNTSCSWFVTLPNGEREESKMRFNCPVAPVR